MDPGCFESREAHAAQDRRIHGAEHEMFRSNVRRFFAERVQTDIDRRENEGIVPRSLWCEAGQLGILCCDIPQRCGGQGADFKFNMNVAEEIGYSIDGGSICLSLQSNITSCYLLHQGSEALKRRLLPGMAGG